MKSFLFLIFCLIILQSFGQTDKQLLERALFNLPNVSFTDVSKPTDPFLTYDLLIKQPLDHQNPEKGTFYQLVQLRHKGFKNPTVIETNGYQLSRGRNEVEKMLDANNISVEYRYFGKSVPDSMQWQYLSNIQATADLHAINQLFKQLYKGKWVSTGISKGGQTTLYYKYLYPEDVDVAIPYVAPIDNAFEDLRLYTFMDTIGTPQCRQRIFDFQKFLLMHEKESVEKLKWFAKGGNMTFKYVGDLGKTFEYAVLEYPFAFWQWGRSNDSIPTNKNLDDYLDELMKTSSISNFSDSDLKFYGPHYYLAATETGYYGYNIAPFKKYIRHFTSNPSATFPPKEANAKPTDGKFHEGLQKWLAEKGNNILYIYGGIDAWSAARVLVSDKVNSKSYLIPGVSHGTARIRNLPEGMKNEFVGKIKEWTGLDAKTEVLK
jgi:hypothetical protein